MSRVATARVSALDDNVIVEVPSDVRGEGLDLLLIDLDGQHDEVSVFRLARHAVSMAHRCTTHVRSNHVGCADAEGQLRGPTPGPCRPGRVARVTRLIWPGSGISWGWSGAGGCSRRAEG